MKNSISKIFNDNKSGSSELVIKLNRYIKNHPDENLSEIIAKAEKELSSFATVSNYLKKLKKIKSKKEKVYSFVNNFEEEFTHRFDRLYSNAKKELKKYSVILTLSNSGTVKEVLNFWKDDVKNPLVIIAESRPMNEGRNLAKAFLKEKIKVKLITDAEIALFIKYADCVVSGADMILNNGNTVNKTGSMAAAVLCNYYEKPFFVLATKDKITNKNSFKYKNHNPNEIWKHKHPKLKIENIYFEEIEKNLITKIFTD